jgi:hypothetical protein
VAVRKDCSKHPHRLREACQEGKPIQGYNQELLNGTTGSVLTRIRMDVQGRVAGVLQAFNGGARNPEIRAVLTPGGGLVRPEVIVIVLKAVLPPKGGLPIAIKDLTSGTT